jgi:hypothetical protein
MAVDFLEDTIAMLLKLTVIGVGSLSAIDRCPEVLRLSIVWVCIDWLDIAYDNRTYKLIVRIPTIWDLNH